MPREPGRQADQSRHGEAGVQGRPVHVHHEGIGDGPTQSVLAAVLDKGRLGKGGAGPEEKRRGVERIARMDDVPRIPVAARHRPRQGEDERRPDGHAPGGR